MPRKISCTGVLSETTAFFGQYLFNKKANMGQLLCQERLGTLPRISGVKIPRCRVPKSFLSKLHLISCQTCKCNLLYYRQKFPFLSFVFTMFHLTKLASVFNCVKTFIHTSQIGFFSSLYQKAASCSICIKSDVSHSRTSSTVQVKEHRCNFKFDRCFRNVTLMRKTVTKHRDVV